MVITLVVRPKQYWLDEEYKQEQNRSHHLARS